MPEYAFGSGFEEEENPEDRFVPGPPQAIDVFESPIVETNRPPPRNLPTEDEIRQIVDMAPIMTEPEREEARWKVEAFYEAREKQEAKDRREIRQRNLLTDERKKEYYKTPEVIEAANGNGSPNDMYARYVTTDIIENDLLKRKLLPGEYEPMRNKLIGLEMAGQPEISDQGAFGVLKKREEVLKEGDVLNETIQSELFLAHAESIDSGKPVQVGDVFEKVRGKHGDFVKGREAEVYKAIGDSQNRAAQIFEANKEAILYTVDWLTKANQEGEGIDEAKQMAQDALLDMPEADQQDAVRYAVALARTKILDKGGIKKNLEELALTVFSRMPGTVGIAGKYFEIDEKRGSVENGTARIANGQVFYDPTLKVEGARKLTPEEKSKAMLDLDREFKATNSIRILSGGYKAAFKPDPLFSDKQWGGVPAYFERATKGALENLPLMILSSYGWTGKAIYTSVVGSENYIRLLDENPGMDHRVARTAGYAMAAGESFLEAIKFDFLKGALTKGGLWRTLRDGGPTTYLKKFVGFNIAEAGVEGLQDFATSSTQKLIQTVAHDIDPNMNVGKIETWGKIANDWIDSRVEVQGQILVMGFIASGVGTYKHLKDPERALYNPETLKGYGLTDKEIRTVTGELDKTKRDALFSEIILNMPPEQIAEAQLYQQQKTLEAQDSQTSTDEVPKATLESSTTPEGEKVWHVLDENGNRIIENVPADVALQRQAEYQEQLDRDQFQKRAQEGVAEQNVAADMEAEAVWEHLKPEDKTSAANILTFQHVEQPRNAEEVVAQQLLQKAVASHNKQRGTTGTPQADDAVLVSVDVPSTRAGLGAVNFIRWFEGTFGKRVQFVASKSGQPLSFVGLADPSDPNVIFLDAAGNRNVLSLLGHEWSHTLEHSNPTLWKEMVGQMKPLVVDWAKQTGVIPQGYTASQATPEFVANVIGDAFSDPEFWATVRAQNPSMFEKILQAIMDWFDVITDRVSEYGTDAPGVISDLKKMREIIANAMEKSKAGPEAAAAQEFAEAQASAPRPVRSDTREKSVAGYEFLKEITRPNHSYRGMTAAEYNATVAKGLGVKSSNAYSLPGEGTSFGADAGTAESYINFGKDDPRTTGQPTYLVEVGNEGLEVNRQGYLYAFQTVPQSQITRVLEMTGEGNTIMAREIPAPEPSPRHEAQASNRRTERGFYSKLEGVVVDKIPKTASPDQVKATINGAGIKAEEIKWSGVMPKIDEIAAENQGKVPKEQLVAHLEDEGSVKFEEVTLGRGERIFDIVDKDGNTLRSFKTMEEAERFMEEPSVPSMARIVPTTTDADRDQTRYAQYVLPGGENYREVVLAMPGREMPEGYEVFEKELGSGEWFIRFPGGREIGGWMSRQDAVASQRRQAGSDYTSSHFPDTPGYVAHMRLNEREGGLFIEEIQSDRHQAGREKGYVEPEVRKRQQELLDKPTLTDAEVAEIEALSKTKPGEIPDAPFRSDWHMAMFKRALRDAVATGQSWIGWTTGQTQFERWGSEKFDWERLPDDTTASHQFGTPEEQAAATLRLKEATAAVSNTPTDAPSYPGVVEEHRMAQQAMIDIVPGWGRPEHHVQRWRLSGQEQFAGEAGGINMEQLARERGVLLEEKGTYVHSFEDVLNVVRNVSRDKDKAKGMAEKLWKKMQEKDSGTSLPRKEGMEYFYDTALPSVIGKYVSQKPWGGKVEQGGIAPLSSPSEAIAGGFGEFQRWLQENGYTDVDPLTEWRKEDPDSKLVREYFESKRAKITPIWKVEITPQMKAGVTEGQPQFSMRRPETSIESKPDILDRERVVPEEPAGTTGATPEPVTITAFDPALMSFAEREITPTKDLERMLRREAGVYEKLIKCLQ